MDSVVEQAEIRLQLQRIVDCDTFAASQRSKRLLAFLVDETLAGRGNRLKGFYVASECLGRGADFDPLTDPIVRIEMGKLRRGMDHYYLTAGVADPIRIVLPKGNYQPQFERTESSPAVIDMAETDPTVVHDGPLLGRASICISPFHAGDDAHAMELASGLVQQVATLLNQIDDVYVFISGSDIASEASRFSLQGQVRVRSGQCRVGVQLVDTITSAQCWAETYTESTDDPFVLEDKLAQSIVNKIADRHFGEMFKALAADVAGNYPLSPDALVARFNTEHLHRFLDKEWQLAAREGLSRLIERYPDHAAAHAAMSRALNDGYLFGHLENDVIPAIMHHAQKAVQLEPDSQHAYAALANACMIARERDRALWAIDKTFSCGSPGNSMAVLAIVKLVMLGEVVRGEALIHEYLSGPAKQATGLHLALALIYMARNDYAQAASEVSKYQLPDTFWSLIIKSACYALNGNNQPARQALNQILTICPDFPLRPRRYLEASLHEPAWVELLLQGLNLAGLVQTAPAAE